MQQETGKVLAKGNVRPPATRRNRMDRQTTAPRPGHHSTSDQVCALVALAAYPGGCAEGVLRSRGFTVGLIAKLIRGGLIRAEPEFKPRDGRMIGVVRLVITAAGQGALPVGISAIEAPSL
jgi:hypothetical protein